MACVVWYLTITVYVAIRGSADIRTMLRRLGESSDDSPDSPGNPPQQLTPTTSVVSLN